MPLKNFSKFAVLCVTFAMHTIPLNALNNMAYVEVNSNRLRNVGCYILSNSKQPFFDMASIFAANINGDKPNQPKIYFNTKVRHTLDKTDDIKFLHDNGIKVLLTILGNHQNAGWSCITQPKAAKLFADNLANVVLKYNLDGIDIDDEYSKCSSNNRSMIMIAKALKHNIKFKGKLLTKALWDDFEYFKSNYKGDKLIDYLDKGWEMSYASAKNRLTPYVRFGMSKNDLALGVSTNKVAFGSAKWVSQTMKMNFGGIMVYNVTKNSQPFLSQVAQKEFGQKIEVIPNCLK